MTRLAIVCLSLSGCSLLFDPSGIVPSPSVDLAAPASDARFSVDDLAPPPDLAVPLPDLSPDLLVSDLRPPPDLLPVDLRPCVPAQFVGFFDGGSPDPLDCNACGCTLDSFDSSDRSNLKFAHSISPGWSEQNDGGLTMVASGAAVSTGDLYQGLGHVYLDGDFDLQLDVRIQSLTAGGNFLFYVIGPNVDGGVPYAPFAYTQIFQPSTLPYLLLYTDDRLLEIVDGVSSGTLRLRRTAGTLCASVVGHEEQCHSGTSAARVYIQIYGLINACATTVCDFRAQLSNLRLAHGSVVSTP